MSPSTSSSPPPPRLLSGTFWRNTPQARNALELPAAARSGARYHRRGEPPPLYAASERDASWGELFRHTDPAVVSAFEIRRRMSELRVVDLPVLDITDEDVRDALEVTEAQLTSNDYRHCRRVAALVWSRPDRYGGILAPSAAKQGARTLAVSQDWLGRVDVAAYRRQTPPRRLLPLFEEIAGTLPRSR
jgi:RES domain-containing protein